MSFKKIQLKRGFTEIQVLFDLCQKFDSVICGGYARYCASPIATAKVIPAGDVDLFPKSEEANKKLLDALREIGFIIKHENDISITMKPSDSKKDELGYIPTPQIIKPVIEGKIVTLGTPEEILSNFDFTIVRAAILSSTEVLVDEDFEEDEKRHYLRLKNIHCPISSLLRCCKYARKGYFMRPIEALKLFVNWTDRGENYRAKLTELFQKSTFGELTADNPQGMTQQDIDELEKLLNID